MHLGAGSNKGNLLGTTSGVGITDFREQIGVYVLFDKDLLPVYVGQAGNGNANLFVRLKQHTNDHLWNRWEYFSWFGLRGINSNNSLSNHDIVEKIYKSSGSDILNELEGILIVAMEPRLNKQGARFPGAQEFFQEVDENVAEMTIEDLANQITGIEKTLAGLKKQIDKLG